MVLPPSEEIRQVTQATAGFRVNLGGYPGEYCLEMKAIL